MKKATFRGGIHLDGHKELTGCLETVVAHIPDRLYIPLSQHIGAPCVPLVIVGDRVKKGQKIGASKGFVSAPIHASVSGTVVAIELMEHPGGSFVPCIVIENDRKEEWAESVTPRSDPASLTPDELRAIILEAGIVGKGGATFPSHVKYAPVEGKIVDTVILNGVECEPYLTTDHRLMLERSASIVAGLVYIMRAVGCDRGIIAIEENKMDAVEVMEKAAAEAKNITIVVLKEKYPQGSEKQLIYACTGREVPVGGLPLAVGVIVNNVGTASALARAVELGIPFIGRNVTVSGPGIRNPANYRVRIGTLFSELIKQSGGYVGEVEKIIAGGPMMGKTVFSDNLPVVKGTSGIIVFTKAESRSSKEFACVRCAKCIDVCPAFLEPTSLVRLSKRKAWEDAEQADAMSCIECSSCVYVCPAQIPLIQHIRRAKQAILAAKARPQG
ncbi:MAG: electron transport complex subunit RsxC [Desulfuromonadaceae bacterium]|nr:electron transport complex subunit RsxC [Desulfuromonadaceae bacterium]